MAPLVAVIVYAWAAATAVGVPDADSGRRVEFDARGQLGRADAVGRRSWEAERRHRGVVRGRPTTPTIAGRAAGRGPGVSGDGDRRGVDHGTWQTWIGCGHDDRVDTGSGR